MEGEVGSSHGLTASASSLEESLSAGSLAEVGSDWQLAVDSLTSSMDSSVGLQHSPPLPSLSTTPRPPPSSSLQRLAPDGDDEEQLTAGQCETGFLLMLLCNVLQVLYPLRYSKTCSLVTFTSYITLTVTASQLSILSFTI